jgi:uncharacterized membrane protein
MTSLSQGKTLGGIGAILVLLSFVPSVGAVFGIIGFVMVLVAVKYIADDLSEKKIFSNMMIAVFLSIVGIVVGSLVVLGTVLSAFQNGYFSRSYPFTPSASVTTAQWTTFGIAIGLGLFGASVFFLASSVFLRRSYTAIGSKLNVHMFSTAGLLYLVGAATTVVGVGFVILLVAQILTAVAFLSIPVQQREQLQVSAASPSPLST